MKYSELIRAGREMTAEGKATNLRSLATDPRFPAVVALIEDARVEFTKAFADQKIAAYHGPLAHTAGSLYALDYLEGLLRQQADAKPKRAAPQQTEAEE